MISSGLCQGIRFYLRKRGEAVFVAWLLYLGIIQLLWAMTLPIELGLTRAINAILQLFPDSRSIAEPSSVWILLESYAAWGTIALSIGIALGLWRLHREHRWDAP